MTEHAHLAFVTRSLQTYVASAANPSVLASAVAELRLLIEIVRLAPITPTPLLAQSAVMLLFPQEVIAATERKRKLTTLLHNCISLLSPLEKAGKIQATKEMESI